MNILLVYPEYPVTFWSFTHALKFVSKRAVNPPLGLLTISSMLPEKWHKKLIDMNIESLGSDDILWADYVFVSAMNIQAKAAREVIDLCHSLGKKIVGGGPLFTEDPDSYKDLNHLILNEAEITLPRFLTDLHNGKPHDIYSTQEYAAMTQTPVPDYGLVKTSKYNTMNLQLTRGCPFNCEFCDITALFGNRTRMKSTRQIIMELQAIYNMGWRSNVFFVDDNFIGNRAFLKEDLLPAIIQWMKKRDYPFRFSTEASINLSDDKMLMDLLCEAGFTTVFIGIETPEHASLEACGKVQNVNRDLVDSVHEIQKYGLEVNGGFILGFDHDTPQIFEKQIKFIKESGIISAMVGLLNAPKKTRLYKRLKGEGRLIGETSGNNTDFSMNFTPKMDKNDLLRGYRKVIKGIYGGKEYYHRVLDFLKWFNPNTKNRERLRFIHFVAFVRSFFVLGIKDAHRKYYWGLFLWTLFNRPRLIPLAITYSVYGFHFRKIFADVL